MLVAALEPRVQHDVRERSPAQAVAQREQVAALLRRDPVQAAAQPRLERHVLPGLQEQRVEEEHAELAVAGPGLALAELLEGADVDEQRLRPAELDVVGRRVLEDQALLDRPPEQLELQQRGVPQHREGPLVRIRDERDDVVLKHRRDAPVQCLGHVRLDFAGADNAELVQEP